MPSSHHANSFPYRFRIRRIFALIALSILGQLNAVAYDILPYTTRTRTYSGLSTTVQGDLRSVGMAGATVGLGDSFRDASDNPAGLSMTSNDANLNIATNIIYDRNIQTFENALNASNIGGTISSYPWGFGLNYRSRILEGQDYAFAATPNSATNYSIRTNDFYVSAARLFLNDRLSVGTTLILGQAEERAQWANNTFTDPGQTWAFGFGASWQFPYHLLLGLNFSPPIKYQVSAPTGTAPPLTGFLQTIEVPFVAGLGLGWVPNRFFRAGFSLHLLGTNENSALLKDDSIPVGQSITFQPMLGGSYLAIDYKELAINFNLGTYFEASRIQNTADRVHLTTSLEASPWIFFMGVGFDVAANYQNYILSFGVNFIKIAEKLDLVPTTWHPPHAGAFPNIYHLSEAGLPRALSKNWKPHGEFNPLEVGLAIPSKLGEVFSGSKPAQKAVPPHSSHPQKHLQKAKARRKHQQIQGKHTQ